MSSSKNENHNFPPDSAGRNMMTHVPTILQSRTLGEVAEMLRQDLFATINYIYVVSSENELVGVVSIKDLFRHPTETQVKDVMTTEVHSTRAHTDKGKVALMALRNNLKAIPVVDKRQKLLGILDSDTLLKIIDSEAVEDTLSLSGITGESVGGDALLLPTTTAIKNRLPWLLIGLVGGMVTAGVISRFEHTLSRNLILAAFIPLIVYTSGAIGNQLVVLIVRDFARSEKVSLRRYFSKQFPVIAIIGLVVSIVLAFLSYMLYGQLQVSVVLGIALFLASLSSIMSGLFIPGFFNWIGIDPANASGPIATIIQDLISVVVYLITATILL